MKKVKMMVSMALLLAVVGVGVLSTAFAPAASALPPACNCYLQKWDYGMLVDGNCQEATCDVVN